MAKVWGKLRWLWIAVGLSCILGPALAAEAAWPVLSLDRSTPTINLAAHATIFDDPDGTLTLPQVLQAAQAGRFESRSLSRLGADSSVVWLRYTLRNTEASATRWILDSGSKTLPEIELHAPDAQGRYLRQSAGTQRPFADRPVPVASFAFYVDLPPDQRVDVYLRVRSNWYSSLGFQPQLWQPQARLARGESETIQWLVYIGMCAALSLFNLLLFAALRDVNYLLYVLSLLATAWGVSSSQGGYGAAFQLLWPNAPQFEQFSWYASVATIAVFTSMFTWRLTDLKRHRPRLHRYLVNGLVLMTGGFVLSAVLRSLPALGAFESATTRLGILVFIAFFAASTYATLSLAIQGNRSALFLCVAWSPLVLSVAYSVVAVMLGRQSDRAMMMWASALELVLAALALADRFNQERRAAAHAQAALVEGLQASERELERKVEQRTRELQHEQHRTRELLHNILPLEIADELSTTGRARPARHESVTVLFTDFHGFTQAASSMPADRMVAELNEIFAAFDDICDELGVEKIKTIGDAYMAAAGLPKPCTDHAHRCVRAGLRMADHLAERNRTATFKWAIRVGVHSGPVVAGVVGKRKYAFDIWGDTVNMASRMESAAEAGRVNVSAYTFDLIRDSFDAEYRGKVDAKGKGLVDMYHVTGPSAATSSNAPA